MDQDDDPVLDETHSPALVERPILDPRARAVARANVAKALFATSEPVKLGRYQLLERLGEGGMGVVWGAYDPELERRVAIKLVRAKSESSRERILREGQALAKLSHPNVVAVHDVGVVDDEVFLVMEWIRGQNLRVHCSKPRTVKEIVSLYRAAGEGLLAAHRAGLVHRDFKPENVMVGDDGRVRVLDFGLARVEAERSATDSGSSSHVTSASGTPRYMSPEQVEGKPVTHAADQYAFCVALREALERRQADGKQADVPRAFVALLDKGTAPEPSARFRSMAELLVAIAPRRPAHVIAVAAVASIAVAGAIVVATQGAKAEWKPNTVELLPAFDARISRPAIAPDGKRVAFASDHQRPGHMRIYISPLLGGEARAVTPPDVNAVAVRWLRDGAALLVTVQHGEELAVHHVPLDGGGWKKLGYTRSTNIDECGGGRVLLVHRSLPGCSACDALVLREPDGSEREVHRGAPNEFFTRPSCDANGKKIVYSSTEVLTAEPPADLWLLEIDGGPPRRLTSDRASNLAATFHPDGETIVFSSTRSGKRNLWELRIDGGGLRQLTFGDGPDNAPGITPDGRVLIYNIDITAWPLVAQAPGSAPRRITGRVDVDEPQAAPDGREVVAESNTINGKRLVAVSVADGTLREIAVGARPALSVDGEEVFYRGEPDRDHVRAVARAGGTPREVGVAPGPVEAISLDTEWVHLAVHGANGLESWRLPIAGGAAERDAPAPWFFVAPAKVGGWRAFVRLASKTERELRIVPPGAGPDDSGGHTVRALQADWYRDGTAIAYYSPPWVRRLDLATGAETRLFEASDYVMITVAPDGQTIYTIEPKSHVRRMAITNFGSR